MPNFGSWEILDMFASTSSVRSFVVTLPVPNSMLQSLMPHRSRLGMKPPKEKGSAMRFRTSSPAADMAARVFSVPPEEPAMAPPPVL